MRVALISDDGLPDARIEKIINTLGEVADEIHFIGKFNGFTGIRIQKKPIIHNLNWRKETNLLLPPYYQWMTKKVGKILNEIRPDVIVASNPVSASIVDKFKYPMLFDYHEVWSIQLNYIKPINLKSEFAHLIRKKKYVELEEKLISNYVTLTISNSAKQYFYEKYGNSKTYVVKNYVSKYESDLVNLIPSNQSTKIFAYIGKDLSTYSGHLYRDMRITMAILDRLKKEDKRFKVIVVGSKKSMRTYIHPIGVVKHILIYKIISSSHFGLLTYYPSSFHRFINPNKFYMYVHSGLLPVITSSMTEIVEEMSQYVVSISAENYTSELYRKLKELIDMSDEELYKLRKQIREYARRNLIWERQNSTIIHALKKT